MHHTKWLMTAFVVRHEFDIAPYMECYVKDRQKMSAVNIRVASWSTHHRRSVSTVRRWSVWQSINRRAASSPIVRVGGHEISFAGQNVRRMHSAKPFFFPLEVILFVKNILLSISFAHSRSLLKLKFNTQTGALCTLIESSAGGPCAICFRTRRVLHSSTREIWVSISNPEAVTGLRAISANATLYDPWLVSGREWK